MALKKGYMWSGLANNNGQQQMDLNCSINGFVKVELKRSFVLVSVNLTRVVLNKCSFHDERIWFEKGGRALCQ